MCPDKTLDKSVGTNLKLWICRSFQIHNLIRNQTGCWITGLCQVCSKHFSVGWSGYESHDWDGEITAGFTHMGCGGEW